MLAHVLIKDNIVSLKKRVLVISQKPSGKNNSARPSLFMMGAPIIKDFIAQTEDALKRGVGSRTFSIEWVRYNDSNRMYKGTLFISPYWKSGNNYSYAIHGGNFFTFEECPEISPNYVVDDVVAAFTRDYVLDCGTSDYMRGVFAMVTE